MHSSQNTRYNHSFEVHNLKDPEIIVPYLIELFHPSSVVDVGCGLGNFLKVFQDNGVKEIIGMDGNWVDLSKLFINPTYFKAVDLEKGFTFEKKFDLVICLEVAEHLSESSADAFIDNLVRLGDIIIFSAAIPNQGGDNHLNEQPFQYWIEKFERRGFLFYDIFRDHFWNDKRIRWWYKQNMFLVMNKEYYSKDISSTTTIYQHIHPELFSFYVEKFRYSTTKIEKILNGDLSLKFYLQLFKTVIKKKVLRNQKD